MIGAAIIRWALARKPDFVIGGDEDPYLWRWWLIPRNRFFNVYVHLFLRGDEDRELHDHPWLANLSILLRGDYMEHTPTGEVIRRAGQWKFRWGRAPHRIELLGSPVWTVFITGPVVRHWGFYTESGWVHWRDFLAGKGTD